MSKDLIPSGGRSPALTPRKTMQALLEVENDRLLWAKLQQAVRSTTLTENSWKEPAKHLTEARKVVAGIPMTLEELEETEETLKALNATPCEPRQLELLLGVLIDNYPNANPPSIEGYVNGLFLSITQENRQAAIVARPGKLTLISAQALAAAIVRAWREHKFPPSSAEVVALCQETREQFGRAVPALRRLQEVKALAEEVLIVSGELTDYSDGSGDGPKLLAQFRGLH